MVDKVTIPLPVGTKFASENRGTLNFQKVVVEAFEGSSTDSAGRFRVSNPIVLFESRLLNDSKEPLFWDEALISGGGITASTPTQAQPYIDITSTANTAGVFVRQTYQRFRGGHIVMNGVLALSGGGIGAMRDIGKFDDDNGAFFRYEEGLAYVVTRSNDSGVPIDNAIVQTAWNRDVFDGSNNENNPSGILLDWSKLQDLVIDHEWPGAVRFGVDIAGKIFYGHEVIRDNLNTIPWSSSPNLPLRSQITTTANTPETSMRGVSATVISDGLRAKGTIRGATTPAPIPANVTTNVYALIGIRLKPTALDCIADLAAGQVFVETNNDQYEVFLAFRPTVSGTFTYVDDPDSCMEIAIGDGSQLLTGGVLAPSIFGQSQTESTITADDSLRLGSAIDGTPDEYVLALRPLTANQNVNASLLWRQTF